MWASAATVLLLMSGVTLYFTLKPKAQTTAQSAKPESKGRALPWQPSPAFSARHDTTAVPGIGRAGTNQRHPRRPAENLAAHDNLVHGKAIPQVRVPAEQLSLNGGSTVFRVTLPLSSLAAVGVSTYPDLPDRQVTADVAVDPFGAIIAVRLVGVKPGGGELTN